MIRFDNDYSEGCHPRILEMLNATNAEQTPGYCLDEHCEKARELVRQACEDPEAGVYFVTGGTQANKVVISQLLRPYEGVISSELGHIAVHEGGAIESSGHKVITLPSDDGKVTAKQVSEYLEAFWADETHEHRVQPGMLYISSPSEVGTIYSKAELEDIRKTCDRYGILLYLDGARMGYQLAADRNDLTLVDIARYTDVFYIGGTKVGALLGECIVFPRSGRLDKNFRTLIKQEGALLAKGRVLGIQFEVLFTKEKDAVEPLYVQISRNAVTQAMKLKKAFAEKGYKFMVDSPTNQQFPIIPREVVNALKEHFAFQSWPDLGQPEIITRFCTSWCTTDADTDELIKALEKL